MKVSINQTVEITDEQRNQMAKVIDGAPTKRWATRDEMKEFIWANGEGWEIALSDQYRDLGEDTGDSDPEDELDFL